MDSVIALAEQDVLFFYQCAAELQLIASRHFAMAYRLSFFSTGFLAVKNL
jgi:hypothetical protein